MRICMFTRSAYHHTGGMEDHIEMLVNELNKQHEVIVITTDLDKELKQKPKNYYFLHGTKPGNYSKNFWVKSREKFLELHGKKKFDIIHSQSSGAFGILSGKRPDIPIVMSFHGTLLDEFRTNMKINKNPLIKAGLTGSFFLRYIRDSYKIRRCDGIIATSNEQAVLLKKFYNFPDKKIFRVYNGIDTDLFRPGKHDNKKIILAMARFIKQKGIQNIIMAMPKITEKVSDVELILIGDGPYREELENITKQLKLNDVKFMGFVSFNKLPECFNACSVFVNPTMQQNGYDLTIIEAMACAKPVVVSDLGSVPTAVNSKNGILIKPGDIQELSNACIKLLENRKLSSELGKQGRKDAVGKFSKEKMATGTVKVYKNLIENFSI